MESDESKIVSSCSAQNLLIHIGIGEDGHPKETLIILELTNQNMLILSMF